MFVTIFFSTVETLVSAIQSSPQHLGLSPSQEERSTAIFCSMHLKQAFHAALMASPQWPGRAPQQLWAMPNLSGKLLNTHQWLSPCCPGDSPAALTLSRSLSRGHISPQASQASFSAITALFQDCRPPRKFLTFSSCGPLPYLPCLLLNSHGPLLGLPGKCIIFSSHSAPSNLPGKLFGSHGPLLGLPEGSSS